MAGRYAARLVADVAAATAIKGGRPFIVDGNTIDGNTQQRATKSANSVHRCCGQPCALGAKLSIPKRVNERAPPPIVFG
jgi:hypothetical protein